MAKFRGHWAARWVLRNIVLKLQSMSNAIKCVNQRFAVKNSGISCLTSVFDLINLKIKILQVKNSTVITVSQKWQHSFLTQVCEGLQQLLPTWKPPVFVHHQTCQSCTRASPKELGHWFCSRNLPFSSKIDSGALARRRQGLDLGPMSYYRLGNYWINCVEFETWIILGLLTINDKSRQVK